MTDTRNLIAVNDAYRLIDAMRDYADTLEAIGSDMAKVYRYDAERLETASFPRNRNIDGLVTVSPFLRDMAHTAAVALMLDAREAAAEALLSAAAYADQGDRYANLASRISG